jgi:hypothetical protein
MQLIEFVVWQYGLQDKTVNEYASQTAAWLLAIQPIAAILSQIKDTRLMMYLLGSYLIGAGFYLILRRYHATPYRMERGENGHLAWKWIGKDSITLFGLLLYFMFLLGPFIWNQKINTLSIFVIITLLGSIYSYWKSGTWGSMWCWLIDLLVIWIGIQMLFQ